MDQDRDVLCYTEDDELLADGQLFRLLEIDSVDVAEGERLRDNNGSPTLKLGKSSISEEIICLNVSLDF